MSRLSAAAGAGFGALLATGLVGLVAGALYLRADNRGREAVITAPAAAYAAHLARAAEASAAGDPDKAQQLVQRLGQQFKDLRLAAVVVEPRSVKYRFLRKRRFLSHSDPGRARQVLDKRFAGDKELYDLANRVRREGRVLQISAPLKGAPAVVAAAPVKVKGKHRATAMVKVAPQYVASGAPAWPLGAGVLICVLGAALFGAVSRRHRFMLVMGSAVGLACFAYTLLGQLARGYNADLASLTELYQRELLLTSIPGVPARISPDGLWALVLVTLVGVGLGVAGHRGVGQRITANLARHRVAYGYILPAALGMLLLVFIPFGYGLGLGFYNHDHGSYTFVGLDNFKEILTGGGQPLTHPLNFYFTLGVTILWTATNVVLHATIGLALALLLKDPLMRFKGVYRVLLILPWAVPNYITALIWKGMFHQQFGAVNYVLGVVGIEKVSWWSDFSTSFIANVTTNTWLGFPFMMVVSLGALQSIPGDVYEAAEVDGASRWQSFVHITLPLLRPALFPAIVLGSIWTFNMFNIIWLVSEGNPGGASDILITEAYRWAFERAERYGLAAAYALIIFVILFGYTVVANKLAKATEETY